MQSQLALLEAQAREAEQLERQVQQRSDVVARKHELEMQLTELEAAAAEVGGGRRRQQQQQGAGGLE